MNLFVVAVGHRTRVDPTRVEAALLRAALWVPALESEPVRTWTSPSGRVAGASVCHGAAAGPRRYRYEGESEIALFDGLPVMSDGGSLMTARALVQRLARTHEGIEGMFVAARLDLARDRVEVHTDPLGNLAVFQMVSNDGTHYVSNSLAAMAALQRRGEVDLAGASTFLTLGWYANGRTALAGVSLVGGGTHLSLAPRRPPTRQRYFSPALLASGSIETPRPTSVRDDLIGQLRSAASYGSPLRLGMTAGQDSRVCLALALAAEVDVELYTEGKIGDVDVDVARAVARVAGLTHEVVPRLPPAPVDTSVVIRQFVGLGDAAASFSQFHDQFAQVEGSERLSIKLLGLGGEVARVNTHPIRGFLVSGPFADLRSVQFRCLAQKITDAGGLVLEDARTLALETLRCWLDDRRAEGWRVRLLAETFYAFDAMIRHHQGSQRRTAGTSDLLAPLSSRQLLTYAFSLQPLRRYEPGIHEGLIRSSTPELLRVPAVPPYQRTHRALAPFVATKELANLAWSRRAGHAADAAPALGEGSWGDVPSLHVEMVESARNDQLFSLVDRDVLIETLRGTRPMTAGALRALTLVWWFETVARAPSPRTALA